MRHHTAAFAAMTDDELMRRVQADDDRAFELLYDRYRVRAWRLAQEISQPPDTADKVVEDAFVAIWRERAGYRPGGETVQAWAMRVLHRRAAHPNRLEQPADEPPTSEPNAAPAAGETHRGDPAETQQLRGLLDRLPPEQREIIALAFYGGLTHAQIAELLTLAPGTVKGRMRLGLHKLRSAIDEQHSGQEAPE